MPPREFVPADFDVPTALVHPDFRLTPLGPEHNDADWVRADHAELDRPLYQSVSAWLRAEWPFASVAYASRTDGG